MRNRTEPRATENREPEEKEQIPTIEVSADRPITHPLARKIEKSITKASKDERGMLLARTGRIVSVRVSETALPRVLRILDALFVAGDEAKYRFDWPKPYNTQLKLVIEGEKLMLSVTDVERSPQIHP